MTLSPRPGILEVAPYIGGEASLPGIERAARLASNENPLGTSPRAIAAFSALRDDLHRYPDGTAAPLRAAIAKAEGLDPARIVCGAGSDELIAFLVHGYAGPGDEVLHSAHGFLMYPIAAKIMGATPVAAPERDMTADVEAMLARVTARTRVVFLANPNNPTGSLLSAERVQALRDGLPGDVLLVIDAAYAEYVEDADYSAGAGMVEAGDNVVMTRTFSKIHGLASLRLGWAYCPPAVADVLNRLRGPFNVTQAAQAAGIAAIADSGHVARSRQHNAKWRAWLSERLSAAGLHPYPSAGNFILVEFPGKPETGAQAALAHLKTQGILVRAMAGYGLPKCLRISIGTEDETRAAAAALTAFMAGAGGAS